MSTNKRIRGRALQRIRELEFNRDPRCRRCGEPFLSLADAERDHIVPMWKDGKDVASNTQLICKPCHEIKTAEDMGHRARQAVGPDGYPIT